MQITMSVEVKTGKVNIDPGVYNRRVSDLMESSTQDKIRSGIRPANAPLTVAIKSNARTLQDSGHLLSSIHSVSSGTFAKVSTNRAGARSNQFGAVINARPGHWLWIPSGSLTRTLLRNRGTIGNLIRSLKAEGYSVWSVPSKNGGRVMLYQKKGKGRDSRKGVRTLFILKKRVVVPARPFLFVSETDRLMIRSIAKRTVRGG